MDQAQGARLRAGDGGSPRALAGLRIGLLTAAASRLGGGVFEAVVNHAAMIRGRGGEARVFALADAHMDEDRARFAPSPIGYAPVLGPAQIGFAPALVRMLLAAELDVLHLHGIWMYPSHAGAAWARRTGRPYVISPHGMLDPWITARGRLKKAVARAGYERASWRAARGMHALTVREARDIAAESGRQDSIVIPNGGPAPLPAVTAPRPPAFLYLGRIHPKKNIAALVRAWSARADALAAAGATLTIAGWGEAAHVAELKAQLAGAPGSVRFVGPAYGEEKARLYREARFFVLPSHSEGLPMVVLEAWAAATPVLMTTECNLPEGLAAGAAIDCGMDEGAIGAALDRAIAMEEGEWLGMARAAHDLARGRFAAEAVADAWAGYYRTLVGGGRP